MENLHFQGKAIPESKREAFAANFGHLKYIISTSNFTLKDAALGGEINQMTLQYKVDSYTDTSITLSLQGNLPQKSLTLYRASVDSLFVKAGSNLEYFKRIAA
jgi:hypothetical protein